MENDKSNAFNIENENFEMTLDIIDANVAKKQSSLYYYVKIQKLKESSEGLFFALNNVMQCKTFESFNVVLDIFNNLLLLQGITWIHFQNEEEKISAIESVKEIFFFEIENSKFTEHIEFETVINKIRIKLIFDAYNSKIYNHKELILSSLSTLNPKHSLKFILEIENSLVIRPYMTRYDYDAFINDLNIDGTQSELLDFVIKKINDGNIEFLECLASLIRWVDINLLNLESARSAVKMFLENPQTTALALKCITSLLKRSITAAEFVEYIDYFELDNIIMRILQKEDLKTNDFLITVDCLIEICQLDDIFTRFWDQYSYAFIYSIIRCPNARKMPDSIVTYAKSHQDDCQKLIELEIRCFSEVLQAKDPPDFERSISNIMTNLTSMYNLAFVNKNPNTNKRPVYCLLEDILEQIINNDEYVNEEEMIVIGLSNYYDKSRNFEDMALLIKDLSGFMRNDIFTTRRLRCYSEYLSLFDNKTEKFEGVIECGEVAFKKAFDTLFADENLISTFEGKEILTQLKNFLESTSSDYISQLQDDIPTIIEKLFQFGSEDSINLSCTLIAKIQDQDIKDTLFTQCFEAIINAEYDDEDKLFKYGFDFLQKIKFTPYDAIKSLYTKFFSLVAEQKAYISELILTSTEIFGYEAFPMIWDSIRYEWNKVKVRINLLKAALELPLDQDIQNYIIDLFKLIANQIVACDPKHQDLFYTYHSYLASFIVKFFDNFVPDEDKLNYLDTIVDFFCRADIFKLALETIMPFFIEKIPDALPIFAEARFISFEILFRDLKITKEDAQFYFKLFYRYHQKLFQVNPEAFQNSVKYVGESNIFGQYLNAVQGLMPIEKFIQHYNSPH
ncbi:hypothetical protein TVAG_385610 [Trichomonas vaginalis G3]|uniref:Uncharacterized protein n=1 Tax=Trichomonas vaginalis (strain ATCC PRA-98 / G3) TaxID=412133 RepID=A2FU14_TRIV3|nr:hypothetical protein TVAGG3_0504180 [Trichomonas vaginalis G3]EAX91609.1 hypothetical protein TVAG_385610 [Trichomonas vaginalis G3]KAI5517298.1 hypothetical protein TVAGG3_0504180 [Trichomonas vaginalis G3]|eukprot:XP_001304539.1 hypothetical protein [Trichomonas vaginalis G3]